MTGARNLLWAILCMSIAALTACSDSPPILIGFSGQLTGKISDLGVHGRNGAMLAIEKINSTGGINGRTLKLLAKDDENTPEGALKADKALFRAGVVAIIGHMTSSQTVAAMPFINQKGIVVISPTTSTPELSKKQDSFFRVVVENSTRSKELADYAHSALDIDTVVTVADTNNKSYSLSFVNNFNTNFEQLNGKVLKNITYSSTQSTSWNNVINTLIESKPDAVLLICPAQDAVSLVQRIRSADLNIQILSTGWAYTEKLLHWGGDDVEDIIFVIDYAPDNPNPEFIKFRELYKSRFGNNPNFASAFGYEAILALAEGLKKTNGAAEGLAEAMAPSKNITGIIGNFRLDSFGDVKRNVFIVTVQEGEFRTVEMR